MSKRRYTHEIFLGGIKHYKNKTKSKLGVNNIILYSDYMIYALYIYDEFNL